MLTDTLRYYVRIVCNSKIKYQIFIKLIIMRKILENLATNLKIKLVTFYSVNKSNLKYINI